MDNDKYIGRLLDGRYEILEVIGTGGMAVVYKARCHRLNRLVAIKILKDDLSQDEEFRRRFHAESQAVAMLSHPNIMSVYDVSTSDEADYIVMELIDGITLKQYMEKKGTLNWKETLHFSIQIAKALEHAHSRGIVHRDIKPHNVMVLKNGSIKVTDFGIARIMSNNNTLTKEALGSVHYISPEQAKGGRVDNRSDLYSLGVVMYEMMTGRAPYDGESPVAVAIQHINGGAPMPSTLNPNIPGGLEQIIMKAMAVDLDQRYSSATEMLVDLEEFRKNPSILFDHSEKGDIDAATMLDQVAQQERVVVVPPRTTAERVAGTHPSRPAQQRSPQQNPRTDAPQRRTGQTTDPQRRAGQQSDPRRAPSRDPQSGRSGAPARTRQSAAQQQRQNRNRSITIAVAVCSAVAGVAILIFLVSLLNGGLFRNETKLTPVPNLIGKVYAELDRKQYPNIEIVQGDTAYSDKYEEGLIMDQKPKANEQIPIGSQVTVYVSMGEEKDELPALLPMQGMPREAAQNYIDALNGDLVAKYEEIFDDKIPAGQVVKTDPQQGAPLERGQTVVIYLSKGPDKVKVPNVIGKSRDQAERLLNNNGFKNIRFETEESDKEKDTVTRLSVNVNEAVSLDTEIVVYLSKGTEKKAVPNVVGKTRDQAEQTLNNNGFKNIRFEIEDSNKEKDIVLRQSVTGNEKVDLNTEIVIYVSSGVVRKRVPLVEGKTLENAKKTLNDAGFTNISEIQEENNEEKGKVIRQSIASGVEIDVTTEIVLYVSAGPKETTPAPTEPEITFYKTIDLPKDKTEPYKLTLILAGKTIVDDQEIKPGTASYAVQLKGRGSASLEIWVDGVLIRTEKVDFNG